MIGLVVDRAGGHDVDLGQRSEHATGVCDVRLDCNRGEHGSPEPDEATEPDAVTRRAFGYEICRMYTSTSSCGSNSPRSPARSASWQHRPAGELVGRKLEFVVIEAVDHARPTRRP